MDFSRTLSYLKKFKSQRLGLGGRVLCQDLNWNRKDCVGQTVFQCYRICSAGLRSPLP